MEYKARCGELTPRQLAEFDQTGYSENFIRLLVQRGIDTKEKAESFFDYSPSRLHDPFLLKGMSDAVARLKSAISRKEHVLIIGDYDADGICSTAILYKYLLTKRVRTAYFLPERDADGYGLNIDLIKNLNEKYRPNLLITVDCGISCPEEVEYAKSIGIDCIVTDHHAIPARIPDCICVDPKFADQDYPFNDLCGAGVALKLIQAMEGLEVAKGYFDICAIATVADIVSLVDENRVIVHHGLKMLNAGTVPGVTALAKACNIRDEIKSSDISFRIGPKINASGRMGNAKKGLDIILEQDVQKIERIIKNLLYLNTKRQELCISIYEDCVKAIETENLQDDSIIVVARPDWESGVLGIVSARITEKYGKPSIIMGGKGDIFKGSGRSVTGIDLVKAISKVSNLLISFGGHSMAAGLSVSIDNFPAFKTELQHVLLDATTTQDIDTNKYYDFSVSVSELNQEFFDEISQLEPTGCGNTAPVFMTVLRKTATSSISSNSAHTKFEKDNLKFIFFGGAGFNEILSTDCEKSVIFEIQQTQGSVARAIVKCLIPFAINDWEQALVLERYLHGELITSISQSLQDIVNGLSIDREVFINYYKAITLFARENNLYTSTIRLFESIVLPDKNIFQFVFCFSVFVQLGILEISRQRLRVNNENSTELNKSQIYRKIKNR